jgi:hypothetical protein
MIKTIQGVLTFTTNVSSERVKQLLIQAAPLAGQYYKFKVPITAAGDIGTNWASTH